MGEDAEILDRFPGTQLIGGCYRGPIFALNDREPGGYPIIAGDFVTTEDGTGLVHIAPAFGEDDFDAAAASPEVPFDPRDPHSLYNPVKPDGSFDGRVRDREGTLRGRGSRTPAHRGADRRPRCARAAV